MTKVDAARDEILAAAKYNRAVLQKKRDAFVNALLDELKNASSAC